MKILWASVAPWCGTGYGMQTSLFAPRIAAAGHDVAISATYGLEGARMEWAGLNVYPTDYLSDGKARVLLADHAVEHAAGEVDPADVQVITLQDVWPLVNPAFKDLRMASWCPVDHAPLPPRVGQFFAVTGSRPIAMSRFGEEMLRDAGFDPLYVPHGVDTKVFRPHPEARAATRAGLGLNDDAFVVGMVAANKGRTPPRKAFPQVFQAFSEFHRRHPNAVLYLHTDVQGLDHGVNLMELANLAGIPGEAVKFIRQHNLLIGVEHETMAAIYNSMDVLASPSYGEGFGVPIVEAQACGVPVIVTDWTAMPELCGAGWKVEGDPFYDAQQHAFYMYPSVMGILDAMEAAYDARGDQGLREKAVGFAAGYDVDVVMRDFWLPVLDALDRPREVAPLKARSNGGGNRAQRRAAAKAAAAVS